MIGGSNKLKKKPSLKLTVLWMNVPSVSLIISPAIIPTHIRPCKFGRPPKILTCEDGDYRLMHGLDFLVLQQIAGEESHYQQHYQDK